MFADNWKISLRQISRLMILNLFGLSSLILPKKLAALTGADGVVCLVFGMAGGFVLLGLIQMNLKHIEESYAVYMRENVGQVAADVFLVFYLMYFVVLAGYVVYQLNLLILSWLFPQGTYRVAEAAVLLLAAYGVSGGIEGQTRIYEILFWPLGIPLLLGLGLAAVSVNTDYWTPLLYSAPEKYLENGLISWTFLLPLASLLFLKPFCRKSERLAGCGKQAILAVTAVNAVIYLMVTGTFGQKTAQVLRQPVLIMMSRIRLPGGFMERQDVVMTAIWFFALFALLHTGVFHGTLILKELCREEKGSYSRLAVLLLTLLTAEGFIKKGFMEEVFEAYQQFIVLPGMILILLLVPLICRMRQYWEKRRGEKKCENM